MTSAESQPSELQRRFQIALSNAIARGHVPTHDTGLGQHTLTAVTAVAQDHPDATAAPIADAYDAYDREHR